MSNSRFYEEECLPRVRAIAQELDRLADEPESLYSYFEDCLDIEYRISGDGTYRSVEICVACGGPGIYVDTGSNNVKLFWGGDRAEWSIRSETGDMIDEIFEEYYNSTK